MILSKIVNRVNIMGKKQLGLVRMGYDSAYILDSVDATHLMATLNEAIAVKVDYNNKIRKIINSEGEYPTLSWVPEQVVKEVQLQNTLKPDE